MSKTPWIDYKSVKSEISIIDLLHAFGIEIASQNDEQFHSPCPLPLHAGDRSNKQAFSVSRSKNCWRCHSHCGSGNVIECYALLTDRDPKDKVKFREAAVELAERFGCEASAPKDEPEKQKAVVQEVEPLTDNQPLQFSLQLKGDVPFLTKEKALSHETIEEFGIGFCMKGMLAGRIAVPIHNKDGAIVGYAGRGLKENDIAKRGKWLFPKGFGKRFELFNQHRCVDKMRENPEAPLVIVEGFWSAIRLHAAGFPAIALMGVETSYFQLERIPYLADHVVLMLDNDDTGRGATPKIATELARHVSVRLVNYPDGDERSQPEAFTEEELQQLIPM